MYNVYSISKTNEYIVMDRVLVKFEIDLKKSFQELGEELELISLDLIPDLSDVYFITSNRNQDSHINLNFANFVIFLIDNDEIKCEIKSKFYDESIIFLFKHAESHELINKIQLVRLRLNKFMLEKTIKENIDLNIQVDNLSLTIQGLRVNAFKNPSEALPKNLGTNLIDLLKQQAKKFLDNKFFVFSLMGFVIMNLTLIKLDNTIYPWDPAFYAEETFKIWEKILNGNPLNIIQALRESVGFKPPLLSWYGVVWAPLSFFLGAQKALDVGLLVLTCINISLFYRISFYFTQKKIQRLILSFTPFTTALMLGLHLKFFVESLQLTIILMSILVLINFLKNPKNIFLYLFTTLIFLGLLIKVTTPLLQIPMIIWLLAEIRKQGLPPRKKGYKSNIVIFILVYVIALTAWWYFYNFKSVINHALNNSVGNDAPIYGEGLIFFDNLQYWLINLSPFQVVNLGFLDLILVVIFLAIFPFKYYKISKSKTITEVKFFYNLSGLIYITIILYVLILSLQINRDARFLFVGHALFIFLLVAIILNYAGVTPRAQVYSRVGKYLLIGVLFIFGYSNVLYNFVDLPVINNQKHYLNPIYLDRDRVDRVNYLINNTCFSANADKYKIIVSEIPYFNANTISFYSQFNRAWNRAPRCYYTSLGFAESNLDRAVDRVDNLEADYLVFLKSNLIVNDNDLFNGLNFDVYEYYNFTNKDVFVENFNTEFDLIIFKRRL